MNRIRFRVIYETGQKRKVQKFLDLYSKEVNETLDSLQIQKYWKSDNQFEASFIISTDKKEKEQLIYQTLELANVLSDGTNGTLTVIGPHEADELSFECIWNEQDDQPLKWAHLQLEND